MSMSMSMSMSMVIIMSISMSKTLKTLCQEFQGVTRSICGPGHPGACESSAGGPEGQKMQNRGRANDGEARANKGGHGGRTGGFLRFFFIFRVSLIIAVQMKNSTSPSFLWGLSCSE